MSGANSVVVYRDDKRRATVSGCTIPSANPKTGDMLQLAILTDTVDPLTAARTGADEDVCGICPLRPKHSGGTGECYVNLAFMPRQVWETTEGDDTVSVDTLPAGKPLRLGSYGDPFFLPLRLLRALTRKRRHTGYTHQWRHAPSSVSKRYARYVMASIDKRSGPLVNLITEAKALGYRYFRISESSDDVRPNEVLCPNYTHGVQCADCGLCDGSRGQEDKRKDIVIPVHGSGTGSYTKGD